MNKNTSASDIFKPKPLEVSEFAPINIVEKKQGSYFIDFGKAVFGTLKLEMDSPVDGKIEIHLAEKLKNNNEIDKAPPGSIRYLKTNFSLKKGKHCYKIKIPPDERNTGENAIKMPSNIGELIPFRYCEINNSPCPITKDNIRQLMVHYKFDDNASSFKCSNDVLKQVWDICKHTIKATSFCGIYVDGDRERIPYEADAYINQLSHYCVDSEYAIGRSSQEHFFPHPTWPTEWSFHSILMAWEEYLFTGDITFIKKHYDKLKRKSLLDLAREDGLISTETGLVTDDFLKKLNLPKIMDIVDWPPASFSSGQMGERDGYDMVPINTVVNAFHYRCLIILERMAKLIKNKRDTEFFKQQAAKVFSSFNKILFDNKNGIYLDGENSSHSSLHANMFPLVFELIPEERKQKVVSFVKSRGMACSVYGAQYLLEALYHSGEVDYALELMTSKSDRSWWHMIEIGSTMTLEAWDIKYKNNLDWNHAWGAAPANIIPRFLMGIRPLEPGFKSILIQPQPGSLKSASYTFPTIKGEIKASFVKDVDKFTLELSLPFGTNTVVKLPIYSGRKNIIYLNGKEIPYQSENGFAVINIDQGGEFKIEQQTSKRN